MGGGISASLGCAPRGERQEKRSTKWQGCKKKEKIKLKGGLLLFGTASPSVENRFVFIGSGGEGGQNFSIDKRKRLERLVCGETVTVGVLFLAAKPCFAPYMEILEIVQWIVALARARWGVDL